MRPFLSLVLLSFYASLGLPLAHPGPQKLYLASRIAPVGSSLKSRALSPATVPLADFFKGTDLQWFGNISVGTPPQDLTVVFDTGSSTLEFASTACGQPCANQIKFDPSKSSTFVDVGVEGELTFDTGVGVDPVVGDNYQLVVRSANDTVTVGGLKADDVGLFLITNQTATFAIDPFSGIQGMSALAQGFFASLINQGLPSLFSLYLTPNDVGNAEMTIGGIDNSKFNGSLTYASLPALNPRNPAWRLSSPQISVNGKTTSLLQTERAIIFDSGTSNMVLSTNTTEAIYALISPDIKPNSDENGAYGIACDKILSLPAVIDLTFTAQDGQPFNLTIPTGELSVGPFSNDPSTCQTLINALDGIDLVGGSLLKHYYSVWDIGNQRMGFASNNTTTSPTLKSGQVLLVQPRWRVLCMGLLIILVLL